jgi:hypothetical protein
MTVDEAAKSCPNTDAPGCLRFALDRLRGGMSSIARHAVAGLLPFPQTTIWACERIVEICAEYGVNP